MNKQSPGWWLRMTRGEHAGAFYLLLISVALALYPVMHGSMSPPAPLEFQYDSLELAALRSSHQQALDSFYKKNRKPRFNLRKARPEDLIALGISEEHAQRIWQKIRSGSHYRSLEELSAETGIDTGRLAAVVSRNSFRATREAKEADAVIELNNTDTTALIALPGIGSKTARRIIRFRDALGGFIRREQILETLGTDSITLKKLLPRFSADPSLVRKLNVNQAEEQTLAAHPYISDRQAKVIVAFRKQHGALRPVDLEKIRIISPAERVRMFPYLFFDQN